MALYTDLNTIYRASTGTIVPAQWLDQVNDNFAAIAAYYPIAGTVVGTTDSYGNLGITYPYVLPNVPTSIIAINGDTTANSTLQVISVWNANSGAQFYVHTNQTNAGPIRINYLAK